MRKTHLLALIVIWLAVVGVAFFNTLKRERIHSRQMALETSRAIAQQIVNTRAWNADHGGIYVRMTEQTPPNPYLRDPLKNLTTSQGLALTMVNPAYMTRQLSELADRQDGIHFHLTSLKPINPENRPEPWEESNLRRFEQGTEEIGEFVTEGSRHFFRFMAPLPVTSACLKCHADQGYKLGDIRGGISITLPNFQEHIHPWSFFGYAFAAVGGFIFIFFGGQLLIRKSAELSTSNLALAAEVAERQQAQETTQKQSDFLNTLIDSLAHPFYVIDAETHAIVMANANSGVNAEVPVTCYKLNYDRDTPCDGQDYRCPLIEIKKTGRPCSMEHVHLGPDGEKKFIEIHASPVFDEAGKLRQIIEYTIDITARKQSEAERESLLRNLTEAHEQVKTLSGIMPICMYCKEIRDDQGYWNQIESFISKYSEAQFSHSICPKCLREHYPEFKEG